MCMYEYSHLDTWTCICSPAQTEWYHFSLPLLQPSGAGMPCWGKGAHAGTERIDSNSIQPLLWPGNIFAIFSVYHPILLTYFFLDPVEMKGQNTTVCYSSYDVHLDSREEGSESHLGQQLSARGHSGSWGTLEVHQTPGFLYGEKEIMTDRGWEVLGVSFSTPNVQLGHGGGGTCSV